MTYHSGVTDVIVGHKARVINTLRDQQSALTPCVDPFIIECQETEYIYNTHRTLVNPKMSCAFRCHYMYLKKMPPRKYMYYAISNEPLPYLVQEEVVSPFLLFLNKKMVPWSMINILMTHEDYHILCTTFDPEWLKIFRAVETVDIIHLPDHCRYVDTPVGDLPNKIFGFTNDGMYSEDPDCPISILDESAYMHFDNFSTTGVVNAYAVTENRSIKYFPNNVILFRNNLLDTDSKIEFTSTLLSINNGTNENSDQLNFSVFRDARTNYTVDNIRNASLSYIKPFTEQQNAGEDMPKWFKDIQQQFDFEMSREKMYAMNREETIDYILGYNTSLFEEAYLENRTLFIEDKGGQWVLDNVGEDGTLKIPRKHGEHTDEYILMLVNGMLYKFTYMTKYTYNSCVIPIKDITAEDSVELLRFTDINNNTFDIVVNENDPYREYDTNFINNDMVFFSTIPPTNDYEYPVDGLQHFPVGYTIEYDENNWIKIKLTDSRYYGKKLKVVYKHQFRHYWFDITQAQAATDTYSVDLGTKFMYCNDYSKYLVFHNGRRLSTDQYRLCLPVRSTTPYFKFELYLTMLVSEGDRVDVVYTPSLLKDVVLLPEIGEDGIIEVHKSNITYGLNKNLYMVWANGKKIPTSHIENIDSVHLKIVEDIETHKYVCVTKYIPDIDELTLAFKKLCNLDLTVEEVDQFINAVISATTIDRLDAIEGETTDNVISSVWDTIISQLTNDEIYALLNILHVPITDTEEDIYANSIPIKSVMYELIREKFVMAANVDTTKPFAYGYTDVDTTAMEGYDKDGNATLMAADANNTENIDGVERPWP